MSKKDTGQANKQLATILALILWLVTVVLAVWDFLLIRGMVLRTYGRFGGAANSFELVSILLIIVLAVLWVVVVIGGAEYHRARVGQPNSWQMFSRTLAVEVSILVLPLFI